MDIAVAVQIEAIAAAYRRRLIETVSRHWKNRPAAIHAVSLYYETQIPRRRYAEIWRWSKALLYSFRIIFSVYPPVQAPDRLDLTAPDLRNARDVLALAGAACLFNEYRRLLELELLETQLHPDGLTFVDPIGVLAGPVTQGIDEEKDGHLAGLAVLESTVARLKAQSKIVARERPEAARQVQEWLLAFHDHLPQRSRREPIRLSLFPDAIARIYAPQASYREYIRILTDFIVEANRPNLPKIAESTMVGTVTWHELVQVCSLLSALSHHHHSIPRELDIPHQIQHRRDIQVFIPGLEGAPSQRLPSPMMDDFLLDTTQRAVERLACDLLGLARPSVSAILNASVLRSLPAEEIALHNFAFSGLIEIGAGRLLFIPTLGRYLADPDTLLRLIRKLDPKGFDKIVSKPLGEAPETFLSKLHSDADLVVVRDRLLRQPNGNALTDIDLGIYDRRGNVLVLMEFKSMWLQDVDTIQSTLQNLERAATQLARIVSHLTAIGHDGIGQLFGVRIAAMPHLFPVIVTRRFAAGSSQVGFPVLPHSTLRLMLLDSGNQMERFVDLAASFNPNALIPDRASWKEFEVSGHRWKAPSYKVPRETVGE